MKKGEGARTGVPSGPEPLGIRAFSDVVADYGQRISCLDLHGAKEQDIRDDCFEFCRSNGIAAHFNRVWDEVRFQYLGKGVSTEDDHPDPCEHEPPWLGGAA